MSYCVYKLENDKGELYYGMTKRPDRRWLDHMKNARNDRTCSSKKLWYDDTAEVGMYELEWFETEEEAHEREKYLIQNNNCVNKVKYDFDMQSYQKEYKKEYYEKNKGMILQKEKEYRDNNKEKIKEKIVCDNCASIVRKTHMLRHKRSAKCKNYTSAAALDC